MSHNTHEIQSMWYHVCVIYLYTILSLYDAQTFKWHFIFLPFLSIFVPLGLFAPSDCWRTLLVGHITRSESDAYPTWLLQITQAPGGQGSQSSCRTAWVSLLLLLFASCMSLGESRSFSESRLPHFVCCLVPTTVGGLWAHEGCCEHEIWEGPESSLWATKCHSHSAMFFGSSVMKIYLSWEAAKLVKTGTTTEPEFQKSRSQKRSCEIQHNSRSQN